MTEVDKLRNRHCKIDLEVEVTYMKFLINKFILPYSRLPDYLVPMCNVCFVCCLIVIKIPEIANVGII